MEEELRFTFQKQKIASGLWYTNAFSCLELRRSRTKKARQNESVNQKRCVSVSKQDHTL